MTRQWAPRPRRSAAPSLLPDRGASSTIGGVRTIPRFRPAVVTVVALALTPVLAPPAAAYRFGNIVVAHDGVIQEYETNGTPVGAPLTVPYPGGVRNQFQPLRDVVFDHEARLAVYNGAANPYLSLYSPTAMTWTHATLTDWSTVVNATFGGLASNATAVFATDTATLDDQESGLIRFDSPQTTNSERFASVLDFSDVAFGPDGLVYGLVANSSLVYTFDPVTLNPVGDGIILEDPVTAMTVGTNGDIYGVDSKGLIRRFNKTDGMLVKTLVTGLPELADVDCSASGQLVVGSSLGEILLADESLSQATTFLLGGGPAFVAWVPAHSTTPASPATWGSIKARYRR